MNRRSIFKMLAALPFVGVPVIAESKKVEVTTLELYPTTHEKVRWTFDTEEEAITFVSDLIPELYWIRVRKDINVPFDSIRSGYRGAIRFMHENKIASTAFGIKRKSTNEWVEIVDNEDFPIYDVQFAWLLLSNIRVNGKPVHRLKKSLPDLLIMPFQKGNPIIEEV